MTMGSRLPGVLLLSIVAAILLILGFGVAVGIGLLVGVGLGLAAAVVFMVTIQRRAGSSFSALNGGSARGEPDRAVLERHGRDFMRVAGVESSRLRRVYAVGRSVEAGGIAVELIALELREHGGLALLVAHFHPPVGQTGQFALAHVRDDADTEYVAAGQATGSSTPDTTRLEVRFAPTPPDGARVLKLTIERFADPFPGPMATIEGPWSFEVDLTP